MNLFTRERGADAKQAAAEKEQTPQERWGLPTRTGGRRAIQARGRKAEFQKWGQRMAGSKSTTPAPTEGKFKTPKQFYSIFSGQQREAALAGRRLRPKDTTKPSEEVEVGFDAACFMHSAK